MMIKDLLKQIKSRKHKIDVLIRNIEERLTVMPSGRIRVDSRKHVTYFFVVNDEGDHNGKKLGEEDADLIQLLIQKSYLQKVLATAYKEQKALDDFVRKYPEKTVEDVYELFSEDRRRLIKPIFPNIDEYAEAWQNEPYEGKPIEEGVYTYDTLRGEKVRSKSEKIIADTLALNGIPYKYECPLTIGRTVIHPDFTVLRKSDLKVFYWEHCGKTNDPEYATKHIVKRSALYAQAGIVPGNGLFMTFESSTVPLNTEAVDQVIKSLT